MHIVCISDDESNRIVELNIVLNNGYGMDVIYAHCTHMFIIKEKYNFTVCWREDKMTRLGLIFVSIVLFGLECNFECKLHSYGTVWIQSEN